MSVSRFRVLDMDDMDDMEPRPASAPEERLAEKLAGVEPAPGSYWATHEIVHRSEAEVRRGEAPAYVRRIR
uniref:hypothetical protein n=1 Tax=Amycolatopsis sp. CA-151526 TaxID=3239921 RepID=UPI003F49555B